MFGLLRFCRVRSIPGNKQTLLRLCRGTSVVGASALVLGNYTYAEEGASVEETSENSEDTSQDVDKKKVMRTRKIKKRISRNKKLPNPDFYETASQDAQSVTFIDVHEGAQSSIQSSLVFSKKKEFQCALNSSMTPPQPHTKARTSCSFSGMVGLGGGQQLLSAQYNFQDGAVEGRITHPLSKNATFKSAFQLQPKRTILINDLEYKGSDWCGRFRLSQAQGSGFNYLQSIHPKVALGANLSHFPGAGNLFGVLAKYKNTAKSPLTFTASVSSNAQFNMTCFKKITPAVSIASEYQLGASQMGNLESTAAIAVRYQYASFTYAGKVESDGKMTMFYEHDPRSRFAFTVCGEINQWTDESKFGIGFKLGV